MGLSNCFFYFSNTAIFHFHDYGRKSSSRGKFIKSLKFKDHTRGLQSNQIQSKPTPSHVRGKDQKISVEKNEVHGLLHLSRHLDFQRSAPHLLFSSTSALFGSPGESSSLRVLLLESIHLSTVFLLTCFL